MRPPQLLVILGTFQRESVLTKDGVWIVGFDEIDDNT
jgi:hypothetical protein